MKLMDRMPAELQNAVSWTEAGGVTWLAAGHLDLREFAQVMKQAEARFITITATELPRNEGFRLEYLWDSEGQLFGFVFSPPAAAVPSIYSICEAANWIEREVHEEYNIEFTGRAYEPLLLREGDAPGVNLHEVTK